MKFIDEDQRKLISKSLMDFAKIILAAEFAGEFFTKFSAFVRVLIAVLFVATFCAGIYLSKKEE